MINPGGAFARAARRMIKGPIGIGLLIAAAGFLIAGVPVGAAAAAVAGMVIYGMMVMNEADAQTSGLIDVPLLEDMDAASRMRLKPMVKLDREIIGLIETHPENVVLSAMRKEVGEEVAAVLARAAKILQTKRKLQKMLQGVHRARAAVEELEQKLSRAADEKVRTSIEAALSSRREELRNFERLELASNRLEANLDEAESTLAELRSQVALAAARPAAQAEILDEARLPEMTDRLRRLSTTMEESIEAISVEGF